MFYQFSWAAVKNKFVFLNLDSNGDKITRKIDIGLNVMSKRRYSDVKLISLYQTNCSLRQSNVNKFSSHVTFVPTSLHLSKRYIYIFHEQRRRLVSASLGTFYRSLDWKERMFSAMWLLITYWFFKVFQDS